MRLIDGKTSLCCLLGNPARHSLSPVIHNAGFEVLHINTIYLAFEVQNLMSAVESIKTLGMIGASVTIPFKTEIMKYLDEIDPLADKIGAVNTIKNIEGRLFGYNTDGIGACDAIESLSGSLKHKKVLIIGSGGTARALSFSMLNRNAKVTIASRMGKSQTDLVSNLKKYDNDTSSVEIAHLTRHFCHDFDIVANTTPLGMKESDPYPVDPEFIRQDQIVFDAVYRPHETKLLQKAKEKGALSVHGIEMLFRQGFSQFEIWTGLKAPEREMRNAVKDLL